MIFKQPIKTQEKKFLSLQMSISQMTSKFIFAIIKAKNSFYKQMHLIAF